MCVICTWVYHCDSVYFMTKILVPKGGRHSYDIYRTDGAKQRNTCEFGREVFKTPVPPTQGCEPRHKAKTLWGVWGGCFPSFPYPWSLSVWDRQGAHAAQSCSHPSFAASQNHQPWGSLAGSIIWLLLLNSQPLEQQPAPSGHLRSIYWINEWK
jgi:hypothetical protein